MDLRQYEVLKRDVDQLRKRVDRGQGAFDQLLTRLKEDFDCDSLEEAEALEQKMEGDYKQLQDEAEREMMEFQEEWGDKLREWGNRG